MFNKRNLDSVKKVGRQPVGLVAAEGSRGLFLGHRWGLRPPV